MSNSTKKMADHFAGLPPLQDIDHSLFGEVEVQKLPRAQFFGGQILARNWATIPHVTHHDEVDITRLEDYRKSLVAQEGRTRVSLPVLVVKAIVACLKEFPKFNASLDSTGKKIVVKKFYNIGMAVDTPNGLLVPVIKDSDTKDVFAIADELSALASAARDKGLPLDKMEGGSFTLSSIGNLGGLAFTPIINAPEVAILGATKSAWRATRGDNDEVVWRLHLPLSLSYDHRVINGADAAKFLSYFNQVIQQPEVLLD